LVWTLKAEKLAKAVELDGAYFLRTSRKDMGPEEIWRTYITLTRVESAFRDLKGTLDLRPIHHRKEMRVETLREELRTHPITTTILPTADDRTLAIRRGSVPERRPREIYRLLGIENKIG